MYFLSKGIGSQIAIWAGDFLEKNKTHCFDFVSASVSLILQLTGEML